MNRKGFLLAEETLKIVIAVICIGFLVYFLTSLYLKSQSSKEFELAKSSLEYIESEVKAGISNIEIYNPVGWFLISFQDSEKPDFCLKNNWDKCLCICDGDTKKECDEYKSGICIESDLTLENIKIKIEKPLTQLNVNLQDRTIK